ncbi:1711_t:CDS:2 [Ambispora gerdemannii]|uniref:1711_t:CDS:1 n=1 Tax=Ambispora gerdemannii TaxID=144530 RepID=A0A9N8ZAB6_9GLOM|nr:1711_t:CDS:2 [Ambispora gerdemannii]
MVNLKGIVDGLFSYETFKIVKVQDKRLGAIYRSFQVAIFAYIIYTIISQQGYFKKEPPVPGAVRISLEAPRTFSDSPYCNGQKCVFWGANEIQYPNDGAGVALFSTRVKVKKYDPPENCDFLNPSGANCIFDPKKSNYTSPIPFAYIANIENYTMMIEHSIRGQVTSIGLRNGLMDGELVNTKGVTVKKWTNKTRVADYPNADGDIMTIGELLAAAGADLEAPSTAPGADRAAKETYRSSGIVIVIVIQYKNVPFKSLATILVEILMLKFLPEKDIYEEFKYESTHDFDERRKSKGQGEEVYDLKP